MTAPYLVRSTGPGAADVVDRASGERVGRVRRSRTRYGLGSVWFSDGQPQPRWRTRADAARAVWEAHRG